MLRRASVELLAELLDAVGSVQLLLPAGLSLALQVLRAEQGLAFSTGRALAAAGFTRKEAQALRRQRLRALLKGRGAWRYSRPGFATPAKGTAPVLGMAGVIRAAGAACVLAVQRQHRPFDRSEQQVMAEVLRLLENPLDLNARATRAWRRKRAPRKKRLSDLHLERLEPFPQLEQMDRLMVREALHRTEGDKTWAAEALGITREGLRKKLIRFGMARRRRPSRARRGRRVQRRRRLRRR